ncbi:ATP-binding cassette domain-containing protein [Sporichthya brevicatena]|uniref:ATP-binding cassette domain-containing protein n=1 Tax=Sporichthya brevicatena TaxID=171442 RepID=A0ABP3SCH7_9ACTN
MEHLQISDLTVEHASGDYLVRPLDRFSGEARSGELVLLLGPSGSGKTTLLACLAGLRSPTSGGIRLDDEVVTDLRGRDLAEYCRRSVGLVLPGAKLLPGLTIRENVEVPLRLAHVPGRTARARAAELLDLVGLGEHGHQRPADLSGGQQQRVAIARALAHEPPLILVDEPTVGADYVQVEIVLRTLRDLAVPGRAVIVATHDERLVPLADRVIEMRPQTPEAEQLGTVDLKEGQTLFEQGDNGELVYVIVKGQLDVFRALADGGDALVHTCQPGEYVGEIGPLLGLPRSATVKAKTDAVVQGLTVEEFCERVGPEGVRHALGSTSL